MTLVVAVMVSAAGVPAAASPPAQPAGGYEPIITTVAGGAGPGKATELSQSPTRLAAEGSSLYIADRANRLVRVLDTTTGQERIVHHVRDLYRDGRPKTWIVARAGSEMSSLAVDVAGTVYFGYSIFLAKVDRSGDRQQFSGAWASAGLAVDAAGRIFISDTRTNKVLRRDASGAISTFAGPPQVDKPGALAFDADRNLYIADVGAHKVLRVDGSGAISTLAGTGAAGSDGDGGPATSAQLDTPAGVALDAAGNLYIADAAAHRVRKVDQSGTITTVAGNGQEGFSGDRRPATSAQLAQPSGVAVIGRDLYIADAGNFRVRRVGARGRISTVAGNGLPGQGGDGGPATSAILEGGASGVAADAAGNLYVSDWLRVRKIDRSGTITTVAGNGRFGFSGDGGPATAASLTPPENLGVDRAGNLYIGDHDNRRVRRVHPSGTITTVAGNGGFLSAGDGGPATSASLGGAANLAVDAKDNLYIAGGNRVRKVDPAGIITTVAGTGTRGFSGDGGPATSAQLSDPEDVAVDAAGNLYIADGNRVRKVNPAGIITTVAGTGSWDFSGDGGPATSARLETRGPLSADAAGNLYIGDECRIRKVDRSGTISTLVGASPAWAEGAAPSHTCASSGDGGPARLASIGLPQDLAVDAAGDLYVAEYGRVRKLALTPPADANPLACLDVPAVLGTHPTGVDAAVQGNDPRNVLGPGTWPEMPPSQGEARYLLGPSIGTRPPGAAWDGWAERACGIRMPRPPNTG